MLFLLSFLIGFSHAFDLPTQMTNNEQKRVLNLVGLGASTKFLSNVYPLGGYSGFEASLSMEAIDTAEIASFGNQTSQTETLYMPSITLGKGIYNDSDIFIHFVPPSQSQDITRFGASFRWGFYQFLFLPINLSAVIHTSLVTLSKDLSATNLGADLLMGMNFGQLSFILGGGWANSSGRFTGGINGVTASLNNENHKIESAHFTFGATYNFEPFFIGAAVDRYDSMVYSLKSGFLF